MKTAVACTAKVKIKDEVARQVAIRLRAQFPTNLPADQAPAPPPSVELTALQKQRDEIVMQHREILKVGFGEAFDSFEAFVHSHITSNVTSNITSDSRSRAAFPRSTRNSNTNPQSKIKGENK